MSTINLFGRWEVKTKTIKTISIWVIVVLFLIIIILTLLGPVIGNSFSTIIASSPMIGAAGRQATFDEAMDSDDALSSIENYDGELSTASLGNLAVVQRQIIRNGDINMDVEDTRQVRDAIEVLVASLRDQGAYIITSVENSGYENNPDISMTIRVPIDQFDRIMDQLADMAVDVNYRNESAEDVTAQYFDLQNRLESMEAARSRLLDIMLKTETTEDLLFAEQQLTYREAEIESMKGQLKYLSEASALSRITINLEPHILSQPIDTSWKPSETVREAVQNLVRSFENFVDFLIYFGISSLPWLIFYSLLIYFGVRLYRSQKGKKERNSKVKKK